MSQLFMFEMQCGVTALFYIFVEWLQKQITHWRMQVTCRRNFIASALLLTSCYL